VEQLRSEYYQEPYEGYAHWAGHHPELVIPPIDVSREIQSKQLALSLQDEVIDLEAAGIHAIQVDEPTIREGLPLRKEDWDAYLTWAVDSFRLATAGVKDVTQTHSHFCYSDFNDIFPSIQRLDADVISIEASKSDMKLLTADNTGTRTRLDLVYTIFIRLACLRRRRLRIVIRICWERFPMISSLSTPTAVSRLVHGKKPKVRFFTIRLLRTKCLIEVPDLGERVYHGYDSFDTSLESGGFIGRVEDR